MVKVEVQIIEDRVIKEEAKKLVLSQVNAILKEKQSLYDLIYGVVDKYIQRTLIKEVIDKKLEKLLSLTKIREGYNDYYLSEYIKTAINKVVTDAISKAFIENKTIEIKRAPQ